MALSAAQPARGHQLACANALKAHIPAAWIGWASFCSQEQTGMIGN
jgi:hypothetical protein